jgi:hypothetical protein
MVDGGSLAVEKEAFMKDLKIKSVSFNNRKKQIEVVYHSGKKISVHYSRLGIKSIIQDAWIDKETQNQSIGIRFDKNKVDYMPYDQPLAIAKDPDFLLQNHIENLISRIKEKIQKSKISKRYLAEQLKTSDNQIQRLLNPKILNKNLSQLYHIASLVGLEVEIRLKAA